MAKEKIYMILKHIGTVDTAIRQVRGGTKIEIKAGETLKVIKSLADQYVKSFPRKFKIVGVDDPKAEAEKAEAEKAEAPKKKESKKK